METEAGSPVASDIGSETPVGRDEQVAQSIATLADKKDTGPVSRAVATKNFTFRSHDAQRVYKRTYQHTEKNLYVVDLLSNIMLGNELNLALHGIVDAWMGEIIKDINDERERAAVLYDMLDDDEKQQIGYSNPLTVSAYWSSPLARRYLDMIVQLDQMLEIINTLWLHGSLPTSQVRPRTFSWTRRMIGLSGKLRQLAQEVRIAIAKRESDDKSMTPVMKKMLEQLDRQHIQEEAPEIDSKDANIAKLAMKKAMKGKAAEPEASDEDGVPVATEEIETKPGRKKPAKAKAAAG